MRHQKNLMGFLLLLAACALPLLVNCGASGPARIMENLSIMSSQETWLRMQQGEEQAWLVPTWNGRPRVNKPPMLVWMNLLIWKALPAGATVDQLIVASRLLAALFALLALTGTYLITARLAHHRLARLALLITGSSFLFIRQGRFATYDTHLLGWATLSVAFGCLALTGSTRKSRLWYLPCALTLGGALLAKGPVALLFVVLPLFWFALYSARRRSALLELGGVTLCGLLLLAGWYVYIFLHHPEAWAWVVREYRFPGRAEAQTAWYYAVFIPLFFPWSVPFLAALTLPLRAKTKTSRRLFLPPFLWLVSVALCLSIPHVKNPRYILPLIPAAGILTALALGVLEKKGRTLRQHSIVRAAAGLHGVLVTTVCLAFSAVLLLQSRFAPGGSHPLSFFPHLPGIPAATAGLLTIAGGAIGLAAVRAWRRGAVIRSASLTAFLILTASSAGYYAYALSNDNGAYPYRAHAERLAACRAARSICYYSIIPDEKRIDPFTLQKIDRDPDKEFLIYYRGVIPSRTPEEIRDLPKRGEPCLVCVRTVPRRCRLLETWGFHEVLEVEDGTHPPWKVYEFLP